MELNSLLKQVYEKKKSKNPRYSMRAFASSLGVPAPRLSEIMSGRKKPSARLLIQISEALSLAESEYLVLLKSLHKKPIQFTFIKPEDHKNVWNWESFVIRRLTESKDFKSTIGHIAIRTGLYPKQVSSIIKNLIESRWLIASEYGELKSNDINLRSPDEVPSEIVRKFHKDLLLKIAKELDKVPVFDRHISSAIICTNRKNLNRAKKMIDKFRLKMMNLLNEGPKEEVYALNFQLFPMTSGADHER